MNIVKLRGIITTLLLIVFLIVAISGLIIYFMPHGEGMEEFGEHIYFLGLTKHTWKDIHTYSAFAMIGLVIVHFYLNFAMYKNEVKMLMKK